MNLAIVAITPGGAELARRLQTAFPGAEIFLPAAERRDDGCHYHEQSLAGLLPELFGRFDGLACIMATGIVVRLLAPHLRGKQFDPAVVVLDEAGRFAISLLSGHLGGANQLAQDLAGALGGQAVITTATDVNGLPAWDDLARMAGLSVEPVGHIKRLNRCLLDGAPIALVDPRRRISERFATVPGVLHCETFLAAAESGIAARVFVTHRLLPELAEDESLLLLRPRDLVVGVGCNRGTQAAEIEAAVATVMTAAELAMASIGTVASISAKQDEAGLLEFARRRHLDLAWFDAEQLNAVTVPSAPSLPALRAVGASGVCEPAALLAAAPGQLLVRKQKLGNVTVAVAERNA